MGQGALAEHVSYCREQVRRRRATCRELADELGVSERAIQACVYGHTYSDIEGALPSPKRRRKRKRQTPLTEEEVRGIRADYAAGKETVREIAEKYEVSPSYVVLIGRGDARTDVPGGTRDRRPVRRIPPEQAARRGERHPNARLDALCVIAIRTLESRGVPHARIAEIFDTTPENVCMIARRRRWRHVPDTPITPTALEHLPPMAVELLAETENDRKRAPLPRAS